MGMCLAGCGDWSPGTAPAPSLSVLLLLTLEAGVIFHSLLSCLIKGAATLGESRLHREQRQAYSMCPAEIPIIRNNKANFSIDAMQQQITETG